MNELNFMQMFLAMSKMTSQTREEEVAYREKIIFATNGIIKPSSWGELSLDEKEKRMDLVEENLKQINK